MLQGKIGRRHALSLLGIATAVTATASAVALEARPAPQAAPGAPVLPADLQSAGDCLVVGTEQVAQGAFAVRLQDPKGELFLVEICARDHSPEALVGPARTERFDFYLANSGQGDKPTQEAHGLAAMALAAAIAPREHEIEVTGLLTLRERLSRHSETMMSLVTPPPSRNAS